MIFQQLYLDCLAQASYLIGDETTRTAAIVDPRRDVQLYLDEARRHDLQIRHVFLTHFHADFIAGHLELRDRTGATIHLGARARAEYAFAPMKEGDAVRFGHIRLEVLETPGHTPESISILVYDSANDAELPYAVLTGDTLFVGDVGRPDLRASLGWAATDLGRLLYTSLRTKLLPLPDRTLVYPAHGAGSLCGKSISSETVSTIGGQRQSNYALQPMSQDEFVNLVTADQPDAPPYFTYDAVLNSQERPTLDAVLERELTPLSLDEVMRLAADGAQLLDVRDPGEFAHSHLRGSLNIGLGGQYATWAGTLLVRHRPIVLIAEPGREVEAATRLGRIGFDHATGYLNGGLPAVENRPELLLPTERVSASDLAEILAATITAASPAALVVDVRTIGERQRRQIHGSIGIPLNQLPSRMTELSRDRRMVVYCAGGYRSSIAASVLQRAGFNGVMELAGGLAAWEAARLPMV
jgi:glyoxylase-like metal-dependent hydrolase (beta-lactamase superfamily II)/rhodanese-related sulfurtransferase